MTEMIAPRIVRHGICQNCNKKIGDEYVNCHGKKSKIKRTSVHHFAEYDYNDILKDTRELCNSCHSKETRRLSPRIPRDSLGRFTNMNKYRSKD